MRDSESESESENKSERERREPSLLLYNLRSDIPSLLPYWSYRQTLVHCERGIVLRCEYPEAGIIGGHLGVWLPHLAYVIPCSCPKKRVAFFLAIEQKLSDLL